ncbi:MAG: Phosphoesterase family protein [Mucilaginibacter sp.]|nr:Phosphoesterase family protein [Mucilaginibacter sp.]
MRTIQSITGLILISILFSFRQGQNDIHRFDHVVIVIEENHAYRELIGSANAPYINELAKGGTLFTNSHGIGHPSQPNYLVLFSGSTQGIKGDECLEKITPFKTPNLGTALISKGLTFKGYAQTMPAIGFLGCTSLSSSVTVGHLYARKHTPWVNWLGTGPNCIPDSLSVPMTNFPKNFKKLPTVSFVVPDMDYDMHNIGLAGDGAAIRRGDHWLKDHLSAYAEWAKKHNSLLIVTFDEDDYDPQNGNKIPTIFYGANVNQMEYSNTINHYHLLHTIEVMYGLPSADNVSAAPISGIWGK